MDNEFKLLQNVVNNVSRETYVELQQFVERVKVWSNHINLVSPNSLSQLWVRHILDSAQIFTYGMNQKQWLDLGSGGGFPGIVLAILFKNLNKNINSDNQYFIHLIESNHKKVSFLHSMITEFNLPAKVIADRIENINIDNKNIDVITARAVAPLDLLLKLILPLFSIDTVALLPKGKTFQDELLLAKKKFNFKYSVITSKIDNESVILKISELSSK
ncbi:16S rRNA (guanine(527)-N(7))-methyltransferase RsmG [Bartonella sp. DGB1]|uniref:16S rRNA (guanine(527)-N(7))-methyltransferase RsmG n=1 Tax=Bartonella sp. DGB1 TaxID=3239807 RepID=UPI003524B7AD